MNREPISFTFGRQAQSAERARAARLAAPTIPAPAPETPAAPKPVCATCGDTHRVVLGQRYEGDGPFTGPCIECPRPCRECVGRMENGKPNAYCAATPCACGCHRRREHREAAIVEADRRAMWPEPESGIAGAYVENAPTVVCTGCSQATDPDVCGCGVERQYHDHAEHDFVPMGCDCGRDDGSEIEPPFAEPTLAEPEPIHRALARATIAEQRLEDLERRLFDLTEQAAALALSWEAAAVKRAAEGDDAGAALIRGFIADQEQLLAGLTGESAGAGGEA